MKLLLLVLSVFAAGTLSSAGRRCVSDCKNKPNGDYQSCKGCKVYVTCSNGLTYDNRPCPSNLVWDDDKKRCEWTSPTCGGDGRVPDKCPDPDGGKTRVPPNCARKWVGKTVWYRCHRGWWHSGGDFTRKCVNGKWTGKKPVCKKCNDPDGGHIPTGSIRKIIRGEATYRCDRPRWRYVSGDRVRTCSWKNGKWSGKPIKCARCCVDNCNKMKDGDYQSCKGCNVYVTCSNGLTYDNRPCPDDLVWDDHKKRCEWHSPTCNY